MKMISKETIAEIRDMYFNLETIENIAKKLQISLPSVKKYVSDWFTLYEFFICSQIAIDKAEELGLKIVDKVYPLYNLTDDEMALVREEFEREIAVSPIKKVMEKYCIKFKERKKHEL
jgi:hypothetical protein